MNHPNNIRNLVSKDKKEFAKKLRKDMTRAEKRFWYNRQTLKANVRRQAVILGWIVDFYIPKKFLAIEIDGSIHDLQKQEDQKRDEVLWRKKKITTLRYTNDQIFKDLDKIYEEINFYIDEFDKLPKEKPKRDGNKINNNIKLFKSLF